MIQVHDSCEIHCHLRKGIPVCDNVFLIEFAECAKSFFTIEKHILM